ncbi:MAG: hypothetical protein V1846_01700 [Candidatus Komeilibacteria bacterium]
MYRKIRGVFILIIIIIICAVSVYLASRASYSNKLGRSISESEARVIAEKACIKGGEALAAGSYNENSRTWWFDANLNATKPGCNPACVVSSETKKAEINWRCTGLIPAAGATDEILSLFEAKYPKYASTLTVKINQEGSDHLRGSVSFSAGQAGGIFLASKVNNVWQLDFDGNGQIPCSLTSTAKGYPPDMLPECANVKN